MNESQRVPSCSFFLDRRSRSRGEGRGDVAQLFGRHRMRPGSRAEPPTTKSCLPRAEPPTTKSCLPLRHVTATVTASPGAAIDNKEQLGTRWLSFIHARPTVSSDDNLRRDDRDKMPCLGCSLGQATAARTTSGPHAPRAGPWFAIDFTGPKVPSFQQHLLPFSQS